MRFRLRTRQTGKPNQAAEAGLPNRLSPRSRPGPSRPGPLPAADKAAESGSTRADPERRPESPSFDLAESERLMQMGREALESGHGRRALKLFQQAVQAAPTPSAINNLALAMLEERNDPQRALQILQPNLEPSAPSTARSPALLPDESPPVPNPFAHATAARCYHRLGDAAAARRHLETAIGAFDEGLPLVPPGLTRLWREYTGVILLAAITLEDDRLAWELYRRWSSHHVLPLSHHLGATAAFNVRRFQAASRIWRRLAEREENWEIAGKYARVSELCEQGLVPPFRLPAAMPRMEPLQARLRRSRRDLNQLEGLAENLSRDPHHRVVMLSSALDPHPANPQYAEMAMTLLVAYTGPWGEQLARAVLLSGSTTVAQKQNAALGLVQAGLVRPGEKISAYVDGRMQQIAIQQVPVTTTPEPQLEQRRKEAVRLHQEGRSEEAKQILEELMAGDSFYVPAAVTYSGILVDEGNVSQARRYLEMARTVFPDHPVVLLQLAVLCGMEGKLDEGRRLLQRIRTDDPEIRSMVRTLRSAMRDLNDA